MVDVLVSMIVAVAASILASAQHTITLLNNCGYGVPVYVDSSHSPVVYVSFGVTSVPPNCRLITFLYFCTDRATTRNHRPSFECQCCGSGQLVFEYLP